MQEKHVNLTSQDKYQTVLLFSILLHFIKERKGDIILKLQCNNISHVFLDINILDFNK